MMGTLWLCGSHTAPVYGITKTMSSGRQFQDPVHIVPGQFWDRAPLARRAVPRGIPGIVIWAVGAAVYFGGHLYYYRIMQQRR